jgi:hypothetical protein
MTPEEIMRYIMSLIGGGLMVGVGNWINAARLARKQQTISEIRDQLRLLYGPLYFLTSQNEKLFGLSNTISEAYQRDETI